MDKRSYFTTIQKALWVIKCIISLGMIGQCEQCGLTNVEVKPTKIENNKTRILCNQCRPADGAYAY
jgi:recombinational DNA repair protein (RecF pathway)